MKSNRRRINVEILLCCYFITFFPITGTSQSIELRALPFTINQFVEQYEDAQKHNSSLLLFGGAIEPKIDYQDTFLGYLYYRIPIIEGYNLHILCNRQNQVVAILMRTLSPLYDRTTKADETVIRHMNTAMVSIGAVLPQISNTERVNIYEKSTPFLQVLGTPNNTNLQSEYIEQGILFSGFFHSDTNQWGYIIQNADNVRPLTKSDWLLSEIPGQYITHFTVDSWLEKLNYRQAFYRERLDSNDFPLEEASYNKTLIEGNSMLHQIKLGKFSIINVYSDSQSNDIRKVVCITTFQQINSITEQNIATAEQDWMHMLLIQTAMPNEELKAAQEIYLNYTVQNSWRNLTFSYELDMLLNEIRTIVEFQ